MKAGCWLAVIPLNITVHFVLSSQGPGHGLAILAGAFRSRGRRMHSEWLPHTRLEIPLYVGTEARIRNPHIPNRKIPFLSSKPRATW